MKLTGKAKRDFLLRMARGRRAKHHRPKKRRHPKKHARTTRRKHHHSEAPPMAKRRHHKRHHKTSHKKRRRGGGGGGGRGKSLLRQLTPTVDEAISAGTAGVYGFLEGAAAKDKEHFLLKMPVPIASIGRCGTVGLGLYVVGAIAKRRFIRSMARGVIDVAAYQLLRRASPFGKNGDKDTEFTLGALGPCDRRTPTIVDRHLAALDDDDDDGDDDTDD
jgi:hypothetical protein